MLDLYFNETLGKYSRTLLRGGKRILGWDNAPHRPRLKSSPHQFHHKDGTVVPSTLVGDPERDIDRVVAALNRFLQSRV